MAGNTPSLVEMMFTARRAPSVWEVLTADDAERFLAKVRLCSSGCHHWGGWRFRRDGAPQYGGFDIRYGARPHRPCAKYPAHRVAYVIAFGPIPDWAVVRHTCDNIVCVNPDHLVLGTQADNIADMQARRRHAHAESHGHAKLTWPLVREIRARRADGAACAVILRQMRLGVSLRTVQSICAGRAWLEASGAAA